MQRSVRRTSLFILVCLACNPTTGGTEPRGKPEPRDPKEDPKAGPEVAKAPEEPDGGTKAAPEPDPKANPTNQLRVTHTPEGGTAKLVALVQFDERHRATPVIVTADTAAYEPFGKLWDEISKKETLQWKHHTEEGLSGTEHGPGDHDYVFAVEQAISRTPGFSVEMGTGRALKVERGGSRVGVVNVRDNSHGELFVLFPGPDADELEKKWKELQAKDSLGMDTGRKTEDGAIEHGTKVVPKGDPEYVWAVWSSLEGGSGFLVDAY